MQLYAITAIVKIDVNINIITVITELCFASVVLSLHETV